ncbi:MAG: hypothetical protein WCJ24_02475 [Candidatus Saccharibacteria bacterium]
MPHNNRTVVETYHRSAPGIAVILEMSTGQYCLASTPLPDPDSIHYKSILAARQDIANKVAAELRKQPHFASMVSNYEALTLRPLYEQDIQVPGRTGVYVQRVDTPIPGIAPLSDGQGLEDSTPILLPFAHVS